jgi:hypothetical protein
VFVLDGGLILEFCFNFVQVSDVPGGVAVIHGGFSRLVSSFSHLVHVELKWIDMLSSKLFICDIFLLFSLKYMEEGLSKGILCLWVCFCCSTCLRWRLTKT